MKTGTAVGRILYDPTGATVDHKPWWMILGCDMGWYYLYRYWLREALPRQWRMVVDQDRNPKVTTVRTNGMVITPRLALMGNVAPPAWGPHISVVRGEKLPNPKLWGSYKGTNIRFEYNPEAVMYNGNHFWLPVKCDALLDLREELGLRREPRVPLHITIGVWAKPVPDTIDGSVHRL